MLLSSRRLMFCVVFSAEKIGSGKAISYAGLLELKPGPFSRRRKTRMLCNLKRRSFVRNKKLNLSKFDAATLSILGSSLCQG